MNCLVIFAAVLAVSSAQFFSQSRPKTYTSHPPAPRPAAVSASRISTNDQSANIVRYDSDINPDGSYSYSYETDNGIAAQEQGTPRDFGGNPPAVANVAQGSFAYTSPEGLPVSITYTADENGFQPKGDVLPVGPEIPPQIQRALEWLARNAPPQRN